MSLKDKAARGAKGWSERAKDLADKGAATAKDRAGSVGSKVGDKIAERAGDDNLYGRVATALDLDDERATVRLESFVMAFVRAVRQVDEEDLSKKDVIKAAKRRQRWIGIACAPFGLVGLYASSLYCEAAILCHVEQLHRLDLADHQLAAHLLTLWKVMPDYEQAEAAVLGTGTSVAAFHTARAHDAVSGSGFDRRGELSKLDALKFLWRLRRGPGEAMHSMPGSINPLDVLLPTTRVKEVFELSERQLGVRSSESHDPTIGMAT